MTISIIKSNINFKKLSVIYNKFAVNLWIKKNLKFNFLKSRLDKKIKKLLINDSFNMI